ncbi:MAG: hypothetical protein V3T86_01395, partial [Planctomycetota bacterium]
EVYELHFQEGFGGETVEVLVDGVVAARFEARTRNQIGLAHIEKLELSPGQEVTVRLQRPPICKKFRLTKANRFAKVNLREKETEGGALHVDLADVAPGYV